MALAVLELTLLVPLMARKAWSIIIPSRNEEANLPLCLGSIAALNYDLALLEIIVVDNGSRDQTVSIARSFEHRLPISIVLAPSVSVGTLRNIGAERASAPLLAFVDADCVVNSDWLRAADQIMPQCPDAIVGSQYALPQQAGWPARTWNKRFHEGRSGPVPYIPGGNLMVSKRTFLRVSGFNPTLRSNEDSEFCSRARTNGIPVIAFPELATIHLGAERNIREFVKRQWWHGSNVISRFGLEANRRAVALAAYALVCMALCLVSLALFRLRVSSISAGMLLCPAVWLTLRDRKMRRNPMDALAIFALLVIYSIVRALVLPLAFARLIRTYPPLAASNPA